MRWYWWLLIGLIVGVGLFFLIPMLTKPDKSESLEKARQAKADKAAIANEKPTSDTVQN